MSKQSTTKMTIAQMVKEYNTLTGKSISKFPSRAVAQRRLNGARITVPPKVERKAKVSSGLAVAIGSNKYPSATAAFKAIGIASLSKLRRIRKELHKNGAASIGGHKLRMV